MVIFLLSILIPIIVSLKTSSSFSLSFSSVSAYTERLVPLLSRHLYSYDPLGRWYSPSFKTLPFLSFLLEDVYIYSKLLRFETFLNRINQDSDANTNQMDISEKLKMYYKFDQQESKLMLALREHETDYAAVAGEINEQYSKENAEMSKQDFSKKMIAEVINNWINSPLQSDKKQKYERKTRSASSLAKLISVSPSTVSKLSNGKGSVPSRDMLISLAIGMELDREERLHFILYGNDNLKYPQNLKEEYIEEILCDPNQDHDFNSVNNKVNEKFGETIRKTVERKENTCVKKKNHKKSKGKEK